MARHINRMVGLDIREHGNTRAESEKFSAARNVRVEMCYANPKYDLVRTGITVADAAGPTGAGVLHWNLEGYRAISGYINHVGAGAGPTATLQLWAFDSLADTWFFVREFAAVAALTEFRFNENVRGRRIAIVVSALNLGGYTSASIHCTAE
jgi:hypothetical protein